MHKCSALCDGHQKIKCLKGKKGKGLSVAGRWSLHLLQNGPSNCRASITPQPAAMMSWLAVPPSQANSLPSARACAAPAPGKHLGLVTGPLAAWQEAHVVPDAWHSTVGRKASPADLAAGFLALSGRTSRIPSSWLVRRPEHAWQDADQYVSSMAM